MSGVGGGLTVSTTTILFGAVTKGKTTSTSVTLANRGTSAASVAGIRVTGEYFSLSVPVTLPLSIAAGGTYVLRVQFKPQTTGVASGTVAVISSSAANGKATIELNGTGVASGVVSQLTCASNSLTGAGSDSCSVSLTAAAGANGLAVRLWSDDGVAKVPASVKVSAGSAIAKFAVTVPAVRNTQTATLTAAAIGVKKSFGLTLKAVAPALTLSSTTVGFGAVALNTPATQSVTITSSGSAPLTLSAGSVTGTGFRMLGITLPKTLSPHDEATFDVEFNPSTKGAATGTLTLVSNAAPAAIRLTGTGQTAEIKVVLNWKTPPKSADPVAGYRVYRAANGIGAFALLSPPISATTYTDTTAVSGNAYKYYVTCVDAWGNESAPTRRFYIAVQ
ncbi:MAG TPA: choice-of-anchor D domain-containing protein [Acidobacteriaceae bacterium]|nr:choice-of-anchor D domain-containing protein [Acidobacteriaceae bacterium]